MRIISFIICSFIKLIIIKKTESNCYYFFYNPVWHIQNVNILYPLSIYIYIYDSSITQKNKKNPNKLAFTTHVDKPNITSDAKHHAYEGETFQLTCIAKIAHDVIYKTVWKYPPSVDPVSWTNLPLIRILINTLTYFSTFYLAILDLGSCHGKRFRFSTSNCNA